MEVVKRREIKNVAFLFLMSVLLNFFLVEV